MSHGILTLHLPRAPPSRKFLGPESFRTYQPQERNTDDVLSNYLRKEARLARFILDFRKRPVIVFGLVVLLPHRIQELQGLIGPLTLQRLCVPIFCATDNSHSGQWTYRSLGRYPTRVLGSKTSTEERRV